MKTCHSALGSGNDGIASLLVPLFVILVLAAAPMQAFAATSSGELVHSAILPATMTPNQPGIPALVPDPTLYQRLKQLANSQSDYSGSPAQSSKGSSTGAITPN